jgi:hypothetical protein
LAAQCVATPEPSCSRVEDRSPVSSVGGSSFGTRAKVDVSSAHGAARLASC